ncbi:hypothetical protein [Fructilactobacillus carniphilus]|uniref:Uncharacterized protein n=1 Tax=Fructilactobacillus carniphilus TaxID=2940297 RepID=A0ABY5BZG5_9LACO|nr:hypothetical protein [Fructilactobacillus carniphilus]USS90481.1 hypothetical protein M3M37_06485 [Fructilactobacillus carniphilus]
MWPAIYGITTPDLANFDFEVKPSTKMLKVQINKQTEAKIKQLKTELSQILHVNHVTIGDCIRELLKAAYLKNNDEYGQTIAKRGFPVPTEKSGKENKIKDYNEQQRDEMLAIINSTQQQVNALLDNLKEQIKLNG